MFYSESPLAELYIYLFHDSRFATVQVSTQESMQKMLDKIKTVQIHSQTLDVHHCNRSNLMMLDAASGGNRAGVLYLYVSQFIRRGSHEL